MVNLRYFVVLPKGAVVSTLEIESSLDLGGVFYDYWRSTDGRVVGIRYHLLSTCEHASHPVYSQFMGDGRFAFDNAAQHVDFVFDEADSPSLREGLLQLDVVQDFGGDRVVRSEALLGIAVALASI
ncbi:hypothetical protein SAMN03159363_2814 [Variovorax sp. EL159]|nr:hypothetical protein SAMN03159363_2814 [Variovorax sp. EL159]